MKQVLILVMVVLAAASAGYFLRPLIQPEAEQKAMADPITIISDEEALEIYKESIKKFDTEGPEQAKAFLKREFDRTGHIRLLFGICWFDFISGEVEQAETKLDFLLMKAKDPALEASARYLLAHLLATKNQYEEAKGHYLRAAEIRKKLDQDQELQKIYRGLADLELQRGNITEADGYLNRMSDIPYDDRYIHAYILHLQERIYLARNDFVSALQPCERAIQLFQEEGNHPNATIKRLHLAFLRMLQGDWEFGRQETEDILGNPDNRGYDLIQEQGKVNRFLYQKCKGQDTQETEEELEGITAQTGFTDVKQRFMIVRSHTCQESKGTAQ